MCKLADKHALQHYVQTGPVLWWDLESLFDPSRAVEVHENVARTPLLHLGMQMWHRSGVSLQLAPPVGSFLDQIISNLDDGIQFAGRMDFAEVSARFGRAMRTELMRRIFSYEQTMQERTARLRAAARQSR